MDSHNFWVLLALLVIRQSVHRASRLTMTKRIAVALLGLALAELVSAVPEPCGDGSSGETGYSTIASLNSDIAAEQARISQGGTPAAEYTFVLCPNTVLDASAEPLKPLLSNSFFLCGRDGSSSNSCTIDGGPTQVEIVDSSISSYPLADLTFSGIQFSAFTTESISATATFPTTANFQDVIWTVSKVDTRRHGILKSTHVSHPMAELCE